MSGGNVLNGHSERFENHDLLCSLAAGNPAEDHIAQFRHDMRRCKSALANSLNDIARLHQRRGSRIDNDARACCKLGVHLTHFRAVGAYGDDERAWANPITLDHGRRR